MTGRKPVCSGGDGEGPPVKNRRPFRFPAKPRHSECSTPPTPTEFAHPRQEGRTMASGTKTTDTLNSLLRGEISAVETYLQAEDKFAGDADAESLRRMRDDHQEASNQ